VPHPSSVFPSFERKRSPVFPWSSWGALLVSTLLLWTSPGPLRAVSFEKGDLFGEITGFVEGNATIPLRNDTPHEDPSAIAQFETLLEIGESIGFKVTPRFSYDGMIRDPKDWNPVESFRLVYPGKPFMIELDEAYVRYSRSLLDLKVGIQKVEWGKLDEINPVDNLNPQDFSKYVTFKKIDRKIGIPMIKLDVFPPVVDLTVEAVWVPFFVPYRMPRPGEKWFPPIFYIPGTVDVGIPGIPPVNIHMNVPEPDLPPRTFENSEAALRISKTIRNVDVALSFFHGYDTSTPVFRGEGWLDVSLTGFPPVLNAEYTVDLLPRFEKVNVYGLELSTAVGSFTIRTEWAYIQNPYQTVSVNLEDVMATVPIPSVEEITRLILENLLKTGQARAVLPLDPDLSLQRDAIEGGVGVDYLWGDHLFTAQILVNHIRQYDPRLLMNEFDVSVSLACRFSWLDDSLNADMAALYNFSEESVVLTPEVSYRFTQSLKGTLQFLFIEGPRETFVGQYTDNDQIMLRGRYSF